MRVAFYAPLKPPDHPVPSGDRRMARLLMAALADAGHEVRLASRFTSREGTGDRAQQDRLAKKGLEIAETYLQRIVAAPAERPELWFTYHLYHKAPDWIGPRVAKALGIPYVVAEASLAEKRRGGAWDIGHRAAEAALAQAAAVIGLNSADRAGLLPALKSPERWIALKPFLDRAPFEQAIARRRAIRQELARQWNLEPAIPWLAVAAMMRADVKRDSYRLLGLALARCSDLPFQLVVAGDGPARRDIEAALARLGPRAVLLGALDERAVTELLAASDLYVWPAIGEAYGLALLEAQAAGLPVIAGRCGGVGDIVVDGETGLLVAPDDSAALADAVGVLLEDAPRRRKLGTAARRRVAAEHDIAATADRLDTILHGLVAAPVP